MEIRPYREVKRKKTKVIKVGKVLVGGDSPISVQSMTNTLTTDVKSTIDQVNRLTKNGKKYADFDKFVLVTERSAPNYEIDRFFKTPIGTLFRPLYGPDTQR